MELRKTNEKVNRTFNDEGQSQDIIERIDYNVLDGNDNIVGTAWVHAGQVHMEANLYGHATIEDGETNLKAFLGLD